jgi:hypothetical protein
MGKVEDEQEEEVNNIGLDHKAKENLRRGQSGQQRD